VGAADQTRTDIEVEAMALAPIPTPKVLWRKPPVLALAELPGTALGRLGEPSTASPAAWAAAGAAARMLHTAPLPSLRVRKQIAMANPDVQSVECSAQPHNNSGHGETYGWERFLAWD
jgi:hypothetical protein